MSGTNYTLLFAQFSGFRVVVLANRLGCDNDLARRAHDALIKHLDTVIAFLREEASASLALVRNPDPAEVEDLMERRHNAQCNVGDYIYGGHHPLLDYVYIDHATREWYDRYAKTWRYGRHPVMNDVSNRTLCGLRDIMEQIWQETCLGFNAYLDAVSSAQVDHEIFYEVPPVREEPVDDIEGEDDGYDYDPEGDYELLHGPDW